MTVTAIAADEPRHRRLRRKLAIFATSTITGLAIFTTSAALVGAPVRTAIAGTLACWAAGRVAVGQVGRPIMLAAVAALTVSTDSLAITVLSVLCVLEVLYQDADEIRAGWALGERFRDRGVTR